MKAMNKPKNSSANSVKNSVKKCPVCGSANVTLWMGASLGVQYFCKNCGYHGPLVIEE
jgi:predicted RNA-binding Zn-ribbon protein involved in translation (DUF1610 family)